jgi:hypothetical protein
LQNGWVNDRSQCNGSWNNQRRRDGEHDVKRLGALLHENNSVNRTVLIFKF